MVLGPISADHTSTESLSPGETSREGHFFFGKLRKVAMVMKKPKSTDIGPIMIIFGLSSLIIHTNLLAKNQENPSRGFRDRHRATGMATRFRLRASQGLVKDSPTFEKLLKVGESLTNP